MSIYKVKLKNQILGDFLRHFKNWFAHDIFEGQLTKLHLTSYDKAVETYRQIKEEGKTNISDKFPFATIDFQMDFRTGYDKVFPWKYAGISDFSRLQYDPIIETPEFRLTPSFRRVEGSIEVNVACESIYDVMDWKMMLMEYCLGGEGRRIINFRPFAYKLILPEELFDVIYSNDKLGVHKRFDTELLKASDEVFVSYMGRDNKQFAVLANCIPILTMEEPSDSSNKQPSSGELQEYRFTVSFQYKLDVPTYLILETDAFVEGIDLSTLISYRLESLPLDIRYSNEIIPVQSTDEDGEFTTDSKYTVKNIYEFTGEELKSGDMKVIINNFEETDRFVLQSYDPVTLSNRDEFFLSEGKVFTVGTVSKIDLSELESVDRFDIKNYILLQCSNI